MTNLRLVPKQDHLTRLAFDDFLLSRKATRCSPRTLEYYQDTAGRFVAWLLAQGITEPEAIKAQDVRAYVAEIASRGVSDATLHAHARATKTFLRFLVAEGYRSEPIPVQMPRIADKPLPVVRDLARVLAACETPRDRALVLFLADSGVRRAECLAMRWGDVDLSTGLVVVRAGKGGKTRTVVVGALTRRALLRLRRAHPHGDNDPLWVGRRGQPLRASGLRMVFRRLSDRAGVEVTAHALRRTFAVLSLKGGMDLQSLRLLMGHADITMTARYARLLTDDLREAHEHASPVDRLLG